MIKAKTKDVKKRVKGDHAEDCEYAKPSIPMQGDGSCFLRGESAKICYRCFRTFMPNGAKEFIGISLGGKINNAVKTTKPAQLLTNDLFIELASLRS